MNSLESLAREIISARDPELEESFVKIVLFSQDNPALRALQRKSKKTPNPQFGNKEHLEWLADKYVSGHSPKALPKPGTIPDPVLSTVMTAGYGVPTQNVSDIIEGHRIAMVAENVVGELLERYIDSKLDDNDWVWCAGEVVKSVDFIRPGKQKGTKWESLQIKNRDNSENSSSSSVRAGTEIIKWHRTVSRTGNTRWELFPVGTEGEVLSEEDFQNFVQHYLAQ